MGSHHQDEAFGSDYELPPDRAYSETCAGIASNMLSWRLLLASNETKYADLIERTLLNNILASTRADGRAFFYTNTLHQRVNGTEPDESVETDRAVSSLRAPWFWVSCCPTNMARTLASVELSFATATEGGVQLHQYGEYTITTDDVALHVNTSYPYDGDIVVTVDAPATFALTLRIPPWARGRAVLDGELVDAANDTVTVSRSFAAGDTVRLELPMDAHFVSAHPRVDAVRAQLALERGPLVLAVESVDLPAGLDTEHIAIDASVAPTATAGGALVRLVARATELDSEPWPYSPATDAAMAEPFTVEYRPYFAWANRGPSTMRVWTPTA
jgi:DUF1680 family protein